MSKPKPVAWMVTFSNGEMKTYICKPPDDVRIAKFTALYTPSAAKAVGLGEAVCQIENHAWWTLEDARRELNRLATKAEQ